MLESQPTQKEVDLFEKNLEHVSLKSHLELH